MKHSLLLCIATFAGLASLPLSAQQTTRAPRTNAGTPNEAAASSAATAGAAASVAQPTALKLRNGAVFTGLHGFYDYQSNGMVRGRLVVEKSNPLKMHTAYMLATDGGDSATVSATRRVGYAYSTDGGSSWTSKQEIQAGFRLGFPYIDVTDQGVPYMAVHGDPDGFGVRTLLYTGQAGSTTFSRTGVFDRQSFTQREGDQGAGVIWPAMAISPKNAAKQVVVATLSPKTLPTPEDDDPVHFSYSDLGGNGPWDIIYTDAIATSSGGRNILAKSAGGKIGLAYYHASGNVGGTSGIYLTESTNGGSSWATPVLALPAVIPINDADTLRVGGNLDFVYKGETPMIVTTGDINFLYATQGIYLWQQSAATPIRIAGADSTRGIGLIQAVATKAQPNMDYVSYPSLTVGNDGQHVAVIFQAAAQTTADPAPGDGVLSADGFAYFRLWAVGSSDGGASWHDPTIVQDFAGEGDTASIEYPTTGATGAVTDNGMVIPLTFHARHLPGMYAFVVADVSTADGAQPADRGPFDETFQYFQKVTLDKTVFGFPASVTTPTPAPSTEAVRINKSFPNPASNAMTVEYALPHMGAPVITVYDMLGTAVMTKTDVLPYAGTYSQTLDVSSLPSGQYRLVISQSGTRTTQAFNVVR